MTDLTKITEAFGLLDVETQESLQECGGPWQIYCSDERWRDYPEPTWLANSTYRKKPEPVVETVDLYINYRVGPEWCSVAPIWFSEVTHKLTVTRVDGKIDCASARLEKL